MKTPVAAMLAGLSVAVLAFPGTVVAGSKIHIRLNNLSPISTRPSGSVTVEASPI